MDTTEEKRKLLESQLPAESISHEEMIVRRWLAKTYDGLKAQLRQAHARIKELEEGIKSAVNRRESQERKYQHEVNSRDIALSRAVERAQTAEAQFKELRAEYEAFKQSSGAAPGWIYVIRERSDGHYKIGKAKDAELRTATFEVKLPFKIEPVCKIPAANRHQLERELHDMFADRRVGGEWFALEDADVAFLKSLGY